MNIVVNLLEDCSDKSDRLISRLWPNFCISASKRIASARRVADLDMNGNADLGPQPKYSILGSCGSLSTAVHLWINRC